MIIKKIYDYSLSLLHFPNLQKKEHFDLSPQKKSLFTFNKNNILLVLFDSTIPSNTRTVLPCDLFTFFHGLFADFSYSGHLQSHERLRTTGACEVFLLGRALINPDRGTSKDKTAPCRY